MLMSPEDEHGLVYPSLKILLYNAETTSGDTKLSLCCCKPELAQAHKGNRIKFTHLCFLILCSKTLQKANELTYPILCNSSISSQQSISELLAEKSHGSRPQSDFCGVRTPAGIFASIYRRKISCFQLMLVYIYFQVGRGLRRELK